MRCGCSRTVREVLSGLPQRGALCCFPGLSGKVSSLHHVFLFQCSLVFFATKTIVYILHLELVPQVTELDLSIIHQQVVVLSAVLSHLRKLRIKF